MAAETRKFRSVEEFYAHALAIEREAAARYWEFAHQLLLYRKNDVAEVFLKLARMEDQHLDDLERATAGKTLPRLEQYCWHGFASPEAAPLPVARTLLDTAQALEIALENERCAKTFYEKVAQSASQPEVRQLAKRLASEEDEHIACLKDALDSAELLRS